ncbi:phage holin family protein [Pseudonocardia alaniniphila]|uniref:Phage holin family protein n=1 Tax=Pseudonocardia alaniniphila TaxID=75291 RepID=A0ABS9TIU0_9PSEU|nr:phage holin family protein [Pseudonocardia alaniniphila]MCH6168457.1 phage holin family protein [Pseudonocardia alaniniphila]
MTPQIVGQGGSEAGSGHAQGTRSATHAADPAAASTSELVKRMSTQVSELVRGELALARAELTEKGKRAGAGAGLAGAGGVVALYGVGALIAAAIAALDIVLALWLAALVIGVVLLIVAGVLALVGRKELRQAAPPVPKDVVDNVQQDVQAVRQAVQR